LVQLFFSFPKPVGQDLRLLLSFYLISLFLFLPKNPSIKIFSSCYRLFMLLYFCSKTYHWGYFRLCIHFLSFCFFLPNPLVKRFLPFYVFFLFLILLSSVRLESDAFHITRLCQLEKKRKTQKSFFRWCSVIGSKKRMFGFSYDTFFYVRGVQINLTSNA